MPPTHTDSSVFIRILRGVYGHMDTTRHYTEARFRPQAKDIYAAGGSNGCECEAHRDVSLLAVTLTVSVLAQSDEPMTILSGVVPIIIMVFLRILILVQNILIYLLEILNTILQGWRHCCMRRCASKGLLESLPR